MSPMARGVTIGILSTAWVVLGLSAASTLLEALKTTWVLAHPLRMGLLSVYLSVSLFAVPFVIVTLLRNRGNG